MSGAITPTSTQKDILNSPPHSTLIIAPPGAGKTETLALRTKGLLDRADIAFPRRILAITFSNRARDNLTERIRSVVGRRRSQENVTVCNFHGLAARVYRSHCAVIGHDIDEMQIPTRSWLDEVLTNRRVFGRHRSSVKAALQNIKLQPLSDADVLHHLRGLPDASALEIEEFRQSIRKIDYADLLRYAHILLKTPAVAGLYKNHFGHILVDEWQDLTIQQTEIIDLISNNNVTWAGDPGQAIYSFAGANPADTEDHIRASTSHVFELNETHRCSPAVVKVLNAIGRELGLDNLITANPARWKDGGAAFAYTFRDRADEAAYLRWLAEQVVGDDPTASLAIISRVNFRREDIDQEFSRNYIGDATFWSSAITSSQTARILRRSLLLLQESPTTYAGPADLLALARAMVDESEVDCLEELRLCNTWLHEAMDTGLSLEDAVKRVQVSDSTDTTIPPGVHLLNAHVGKGQQFDHVVIAGLEEDILPSKNARGAAELLEELRVLRVMISRAKNTCTFTRTDTRIDYSGHRVVSRASRWWQRVSDSCSS